MDRPDTLTTLFEHNRWANRRLLAHCAGLSDEQLESAIPGVYGSIRATLTHMARSEFGYFWRISTGRSYRPDPNNTPVTPAQIAELLEASGAGLLEWAGKVGPEELVEVNWQGTPRMVPKTIFLAQAINHATEHRAQVMTMLTQLGIEPPSLDGWSYFDETEAPGL